MAYTFVDLQNEVKRRAVRDQSGTQFDTAIKNIINTSLFRLSREALWKPLRKESSFTTEGNVTGATVTATEDSTSFTASSLNLLTNGVEIGRRVTIEGSSKSFVIATITGENAFTTTEAYDGTTASGLDITVHGKEEYLLPIQCGRVAFLWHEDYGYPFVMRYCPDFSFYSSAQDLDTDDTPTYYRMWGEDDVRQQPNSASVITIASSSASDTSINVTVFGTVSGYPDYEVITTNASDGTTSVNGTKSFTTVERVVKDANTVGRITLTSNSAAVTVAVLPVGDATGRLQYKKVQLYPLPDTAIPIKVKYYKDPWRLVNDADMHELGMNFDEAIILLAVAKLKYENSQQEGDKWYLMYKDEVRSLRKENADKLDYFPTLRRPRDNPMVMQGGNITPYLSYGQLGGDYGPIIR